MRVSGLHVEHWRHFRDIRLELEPETRLICVAGANGTGKSHLLELLASCAHQIGLAPGTDIPRGDPFGDIPHSFTLTFSLAEGVSPALDEGIRDHPHLGLWDRTLRVRSERTEETNSTVVIAGGVPVNEQEDFGRTVTQLLRAAQQVHFLSLDADRAYPLKRVKPQEAAQAYQENWGSLQHRRSRSFRRTATLYDEWLKYFLGRENQAGTRLMQAHRRAVREDAPAPQFTDPFEGYAHSLREVLPHLEFSGVDSQQRTVLFNTTGLELTFDRLSGGEREIAFLIGQIERFGLKHGLFLLDEPELHLNADLIRTWVGFLIDRVETGQVWLATHSLEAVEAAGQHATIVLERNEETRLVDSISRFDERPVLAALSRSVGSPAFSISRLRFVLVEGEESVGERERFRGLCGAPEDVRFLESGNSTRVVRRIGAIRDLGREANDAIRVGGVVDRDFRTQEQANAYATEHGVHVLSVHEVENLLMSPNTLAVLLAQNGRHDVEPRAMIREAADARAGSWIFQATMSSANAATLPAIAEPAKAYAKGLTWAQVSGDQEAIIDEIAGRSGFVDGERDTLKSILTIFIASYGRLRESGDLWKKCEGKQVLNAVAVRCGFTGSGVLERAAVGAWARGTAPIPDEVAELRDYVASL